MEAINAELATLAAAARKAAPLPAFATLETAEEQYFNAIAESEIAAEAAAEAYFERGCRSEMAALMADMAEAEEERRAGWGLVFR